MVESSYFFNFMLLIFLIAGVIATFIYLKYKKGFLGISKYNQFLRMIEIIPIDNINRIALVECYDKQYLIVIGANNSRVIDMYEKVNPQELVKKTSEEGEV